MMRLGAERDIQNPKEITMRRIPKGLWLIVGALAALMPTDAAHAQKKTLIVALNQDPDILDPTLARTYVGRIIFSQMCEKLYEIDENLRIHPQLAADMPAVSDGGRTVTIKLRAGVKFNDGTRMDAESVKLSLDRHRTLKGSNRASELAPVETVEVVDPLTVRLRLKAPYSPLLAQLTDRAGMPVSPTAVKKLGDNFGTAPVCVGPWLFAERVAQDRIVVEKSSHYFDPAQAKFDKVVFRIIPDDNVRLANLRSGDIDVLHMVRPSDATAIKREGRFELSNVTGLGYQGITINLRNKTGKQNPPGDLGTPLANDPRVRRAEIARRVLLARLVSQVDRDALVAEPRHVGQLEASFALDGGGIARPHHVHHVDVARAQVREPDVVVGNDAEDHLVELRLRRVEILGRLLDDDAVLGHALGELPRPHAHGRGAEVVAQLLHRGRRQRHPRAVGELREQRRVRRLEP